jgi:hypothetical protein
MAAMGVRELRSQEAQHDSGVILRSIDRDTMQVEYQGRRLNLPVDRAPGDYAFYLPADPRWDDGSPIRADTVDLIKNAITEIERHWGAAAEFHTLGSNS